jgi:hypothetical protein
VTEPSAAKVASDVVEHAANGLDKTADRVALGLEKVAGKLDKGASAMAHAAERAAPEAWDILVRQQRVEGAVDLGLSIVGVATVVGVLRFAKKLAAEKVLARIERYSRPSEGGPGEVVRGYTRDEYPTLALWPLLFAGLVSLILVYRSFWVAPEAVKKILNPKYYAAVVLIESVRGSK